MRWGVKGLKYIIKNFERLLGSVINYGAKMMNVSCSSKQYMVIESANYGDFSKNGVFNDDQNVATICSEVTSCEMKSRCNGKRSCELTIDSSLLPSQHCSDNSKEIYTKYTCADKYSSSAIAKGESCYFFYYALMELWKATNAKFC